MLQEAVQNLFLLLLQVCRVGTGCVLWDTALVGRQQVGTLTGDLQGAVDLSVQKVCLFLHVLSKAAAAVLAGKSTSVSLVYAGGT